MRQEGEAPCVPERLARYEPKIDLADDAAVRFASPAVISCLASFAVLRLGTDGDDAAERCRNRQCHNRLIELERTATATLLVPTK